MATTNKSSWTESASANRAYKRVILGDYKSMSPKTLEKFKGYYTAEQISEIEEINKKHKEKCSKQKCRSDANKPRKKPAEQASSSTPESELKTDYTIDEIKQIVLNDPSTSRIPSTKHKHSHSIGGLRRTFKSNSFTDILMNNTNEVIFDALKEANKKSMDNVLGAILLVVEDLVPQLGAMLGKDRLKEIRKMKDSKDRQYKAQSYQKQIEKGKLNINYTEYFDELTQLNKKLEETEPGSEKYLINSLFVLGIYNDSGDLTMIPRLHYFKNVKLVNNDKDMNDTGNFYNTKTGRLLLNNYKTVKTYGPYDYTLPKKVRQIINDSLQKNPREYLIEPYSDNVYKRKVDNAVPKGNQHYREYLSNFFFRQGYEADVLSPVMAHDVSTAYKSYLTSISG